MSNEITLEHILEQLNSLVSTQAWQTEMIKKMDEAIRGNGKPGLKQEIIGVRSDLVLCQQRRDWEAKQREAESAKKNTAWSRYAQPMVPIIYGGVALLIIWGATQYMASKLDVRTEVRKAITEEMQREALNATD